MGPEMEEHTMNKSFLAYIPANFVHCPIYYRNVKRPFIFIQCQYAPKLTEKSYKHLLSEKDANEMIMFDVDGTQKDDFVFEQAPPAWIEKLKGMLK